MHSQLPEAGWDQHSDVALPEPKAISFSKATFPSSCLALLCCFLHPPTTLFYISDARLFKVFLLLPAVHLNTKIEQRTQCSVGSWQCGKGDSFYLSHIRTKRRPLKVGKKKKRNVICPPKVLVVQRDTCDVRDMKM